MVYINTGLVRNLGHINVFLELWAQLLKENLGTRRLAIKLEGTQPASTVVAYCVLLLLLWSISIFFCLFVFLFLLQQKSQCVDTDSVQEAPGL